MHMSTVVWCSVAGNTGNSGNTGPADQSSNTGTEDESTTAQTNKEERVCLFCLLFTRTKPLCFRHC